MTMNRTKIEEIQARCLPEVERLFDRYLNERETSGLAHNSRMAAYHLSTGGKRLRALIPCWVFGALGREPMEAVRLGAAVEMIHNATLVHDDLQDGDTVRRGKPTVWKSYGDAQAINCGDAMFHFGFELLLSSGLDAERTLRIVRRAVSSTLEVIEGQAQEFLMKDERYPGKERYVGMIRGKTAALIGLPVAVALESIGAEPEFVTAAERAAIDCGLLFQVQDDLLDIYGDKKRDQKATDIAEGKVSILVAHVNEVGSEQDRSEMDRILKTPRAQTSTQQIERVMELFEKYDAKCEAVRMIRKLRERIETDSVLQRYPEMRQLLGEMAELFLAPVRNIM